MRILVTKFLDNLRGTRFKVLGTGLMSRLSFLSSSSCFLMVGLDEPAESIIDECTRDGCGEIGW